MFAYHKLTNVKDEIIVELYLDRQWAEFARELDGLQPEIENNIKNAIERYISEKLPDVKVKMVKIMLGSILVASIPFGKVYASEEGSPVSLTQSQNQTVSVYTVRYGDSLIGISHRLGVTLEALKSVNGLEKDIITVGQQLILPGKNREIYVVQPGDNLYKIAQRLGTTVSEIKSVNGLKGDSILEGQWLKVNVKRKRAYEVKYGDTLFNISVKYNVPVEVLKAANGLKGNNIFAGQNILIPITGTSFVTSNPSSIIALVNKDYALSSSYVPSGMVVPNIPFNSGEYSEKKLVRPEAASALEKLFAKAKQDGVNLYAISGYRSYQRQEDIFNNNVIKYGGAEAANRFSARPGESEHQTGLAMDVTAPSVNNSISQGFGETPEGRWLKENAAEFGFIIRYPKDMESITGYQYEPWHIRYVGLEAAREIYARGITLEQYIGKY